MSKETKLKLVQIKESTWYKLSRLKQFPERSTFDEVINWLLKGGVKK